MFHKLSLIIITIFTVSSLTAQTTVNKEIGRLRQIDGYKVVNEENNRIKITSPLGNVSYYRVGSNEKNIIPNNSPTYTVSATELLKDTTDYKYYFYQEIPLASGNDGPVFGDVNRNGLYEYYGLKKDFNENYDDVRGIYCYEEDENGMYKKLYQYDTPSFMARNIYDINRDKKPEIQLTSFYQYYDTLTNKTYPVHDQLFYSGDEYLIYPYFDYHVWEVVPNGNDYVTSTSQLDNWTFGDFDKDGITEAVFYAIDEKVWIVKFNEEKNTFDSLVTFLPWYYPEDYRIYVKGFTVGDFDMDGKTEIIYGGELGSIFIVENEDSNNYSISWSKNNGIDNSFFTAKTNDINGNGKPEFWVGGQDFPNLYSKLNCYETVGNNQYDQIYSIVFNGFVSLNGIQGEGVDVDNDGKDELFARMGEHIIIFKFTGGEYDFEASTYYHKYFEGYTAFTDFGTGTYKFNGDSYPSYVMQLLEFNDHGHRLITQIYKSHLETDVEKSTDTELSFKLFQNYPNPFNPSTAVRYEIGERRFVSIKVYNMLGQVVTTLVNKEQKAGSYEATFNASNLPSGIYAIKLTAGNYSKTIKALLIK